jgi:hypothetical protein
MAGRATGGALAPGAARTCFGAAAHTASWMAVGDALHLLETREV